MKVTVAKPFAYAHDGIKIEQLEAGAPAEVRDDLVAGLTDQGYLVDPGAKPGAKPKKGPGPFGDETGPVVADVAAADAAAPAPEAAADKAAK